jgi:hypothetical protein
MQPRAQALFIFFAARGDLTASFLIHPPKKLPDEARIGPYDFRGGVDDERRGWNSSGRQRLQRRRAG